MKIVILFSIFHLFWICEIKAQRQAALPLYPMSGQVLDQDSLYPLPNIHVLSRYSRGGTITDEEGRFVMRVPKGDTILFSSVAYENMLLELSDTSRNDYLNFIILMKKDTILMSEVVVKAFYDYETFKQLVINMESEEPTDIDLRMDLDPLKYIEPQPFIMKGPISVLYDQFNRQARLQRKLQRIRKWYNEEMIRQGRLQDTIPKLPEHMQATGN